ncbi:DUF502 domain-containing protein [Brevibacillus composti]|uniref:DUF502 domain-containing protein n=1 Tax=Brevibacillus composti TaxID=2796470 RepID=A0A7T5JM53_9BACL|nr:DUF502 domain-containing protein [Brevibacillus composti]QQE72973.1 DUF502 domain-containing protein [Brevibacillus composti]QUO40051.1 DUF502 domain-containing protein [Brevibacillus composti]
MKRLLRYFLNGLLVITPIVVSIYAVAYLVRLVDELGQKVFGLILPVIPFGAGLVLTLGVIILIGFISQHWLAQKLIRWIDALFNRFPVLKTLYNSVKETLQSFVGEKRSFSQVVMVQEPNGVRRIGFVTTEDLAFLGCPPDMIAVYIPHGMQVSGELKLFPRDSGQIEFLDVSVEDAMRFCLTAGIASKKEGNPEKREGEQLVQSETKGI